MNISDLQQNRRLSDLTTFGIGGCARYFIEVRQIEEMQQVLRLCKEQSLPFFILGKGSNTLFSDEGFEGVVIANRIDFMERPVEGVFRAGAGYSFSLLGVQTARQGWSGLEFASGIPASVGGAVWMNAGANGHETCEALTTVEFVTPEGELLCLPRSELSFSYRHSPFQQRAGAIVAATFTLKALPSARQDQLAIIKYRQATQPYGEKSAGCVFRNPICGAAGALIERSGLKGRTVGGVEVSHKHANFIVNSGGATARDVLELIAVIQKEVKEKQDVELQHEICVIPPVPR